MEHKLTNTKTKINVLLSFELNYKHSEFSSWFSIAINDKLDHNNKKEIYDYIKEIFKKRGLTYVKTGNLYVYNIVKFNTLIEILTTKKVIYINNIPTHYAPPKDPDIKNIDKGSYLYPINYRIKVVYIYD